MAETIIHRCWSTVSLYIADTLTHGSYILLRVRSFSDQRITVQGTAACHRRRCCSGLSEQSFLKGANLVRNVNELESV